MTILREGSLEIDIHDAVVDCRKFDDRNHGLSHCMKAVDFIVELKDKYLFIEIKDPDQPGAKEEKREIYMARVTSGGIDQLLKYKYRDSFLYEWAAGRADKPIHYLVLIAAECLDKDMLQIRIDALERNLPLRGPKSAPWRRPIVSNCGVFNVFTWNQRFKNYSVRRV